MTDEEKQAIEYAKTLTKFYNKGVPLTYTEGENYCFRTLVEIIEKQQKEIDKLTKQSKNLDKEAQSYLEELMGDSGMKNRTIAQLQAELEKKDKIIDLMCEQLAGLAIFDVKADETIILMDKEEVKQYFEKEAENGD